MAVVNFADVSRYGQVHFDIKNNVTAFDEKKLFLLKAGLMLACIIFRQIFLRIGMESPSHWSVISLRIF